MPAQVAAVLRPLRDLGAELVVAYDDRVDAAHRAAYAEIADRCLPVKFDVLEALLPEVHAACSGDWVLRVDADEVVSEELTDRLPALLEDESASQYAIPRRWLFGSAATCLEEQPWWPDFQVRLVRNDGSTTFSAEVHAPPAPTPGLRHVDAPLYHLDCLLTPRQERLAKALVYDIRRPELEGPGGLPMVALFDPEQYHTGQLAAVAESDRAAIEGVLNACGYVGSPDPPETARPPAPLIGRARNRIEPLESALAFYPGEEREVALRVTNGSGTTLDTDCQLVVSWSHEHNGDDSLTAERVALRASVESDRSCLVPIHVRAPQEEGSFVLTVRLVNLSGRVRIGADLSVDVSPRPALPASREHFPGPWSALGGRRRWWRPSPSPKRIPRVVHRIWLGDRPMPADHVAYGESWQELNPGWEVRLWTEADAPVPAAAERARHLAERADLVRYEILRRHGGVYVDTDVECLRSLDPLLEDVRVFAGYEIPGRLCNAVMGGIAEHPALVRTVELAQRTAGVGVYPFATATLFLTRVLEPFDDVTLFAAERFYPYLWFEPRPAHIERPGTYAAHHWAQSWVPDSVVP